MNSGRSTLFVAAMLVCLSASAQTDEAPPHKNTTVFKCTGADGNVIFSEEPCSADPNKVQEVDIARSLLKGSGGNPVDVSAGGADDDCHRLAHRAAYATVDVDVETSNRHIADYQQQESQIAARKVYMSDGSGQLIDDPDAPQAIANVEASIAREREFQKQAKTNADAAYQKAAKGCEAAAVKTPQGDQK